MTERVITDVRKDDLTQLPSIEVKDTGIMHFHFPKSPTSVHLDGREVYVYIPERYVRELVWQVHNRVDLDKMENIIVPQKGGEWLFRRIAEIQGFNVHDERIRRVEVKRAPGGKSAQIINPDVLIDINPRQRNIIIEDLIDDGITASTLYSRVKAPVCALYAKIDPRETMQQLPYIYVAATIDKDKWVGGNGSDYGSVARDLYGYKLDFPRESWDLTVMPESLEVDNRIY